MVKPTNRDRRTNVLLVASGLGIGGAERVIQQLTHTIDRRRFAVSICCIKVQGSIGNELARAGIDIVTLLDAAESKVNYFTFLRLFRVIRTKQIDIVHTHTTDGLVDAAICRLLIPRLRVIHTFHFGNYPHIGARTKWMESLFSRLATRLLAVGEAQRQQLRNVYRFRDRTIGTVLNGVMKACGTDDGSFRARIGADNRILVGTIATLIEQKGLQDLLAVASQFRDSDNRIRFVIVGEGRLRPALEAMRRDLGLEDIVVFTGWLTNASEVALPAFDIFFQPSLWEAMSIAILEAMAAGKPVVATRVGETPYVIKDEVDGLLVDPKNVTGMVVALRRLIDDPALRRRLGDAAARKVAERFTVEQMTRSYEDIYQSAVHEKYA